MTAHCKAVTANRHRLRHNNGAHLLEQLQQIGIGANLRQQGAEGLGLFVVPELDVPSLAAKPTAQTLR
eukprot:12891540-Prorocentrum_lima.AAC.1